MYTGKISLVPLEIKEISIDSTVTDYMQNNWKELRAYAKYLLKGDDDLTDDLMADVYVNMSEKEARGWRFNSNYNGQVSFVNEYIRGKIKLYSKNKRYRQSMWLSIGRNSGGTDDETYDSYIMDEEHLSSDASLSDIDLSIIKLDIQNNLRVIENRRADGGLIDLVVFVRCFDMIFSNKLSIQNELLRDIMGGINVDTELYDVLLALVKAYDRYNKEFMEAIEGWEA